MLSLFLIYEMHLPVHTNICLRDGNFLHICYKTFHIHFTAIANIHIHTYI